MHLAFKKFQLLVLIASLFLAPWSLSAQEETLLKTDIGNAELGSSATYDKGSKTWFLGSTGKPATSPGGGVISQYAEGELQCKVDFNTNLAPTKGICVYKSSGSAGTV